MAHAEDSPALLKGNQVLAIIAALAGWIVPGLGHVLLRRWPKAIAYFVAVGVLAVVGLRLRGNVFTYGGADPFGVLGFIADAGSGIFYFLAQTINPAGADVSRAAGDYGTRLIAAAGVVNMLAMMEAFQIGFRGGDERRGSE